MCKESFKEVSRVLQERLRGVLREFSVGFKKFKGTFKEESNVFQGCVKKVFRVIQARIKGV